MIGAYSSFINLLTQKNAEYISFLCSGVNDKVMKEIGFCNRDDSNVILPVYYEPFERINVDLDFHFWTKHSTSNVVIVKGDPDQDRPNVLNKNILE